MLGSIGNARKTLTAIVLALILALGAVGFVGWYNLFREVPTYYESAEDHFKYGSIGVESNEGLPYWVWMVLPRLFPEYLPGPGGYSALGITWEEGQELPVGFSKKTVGFPRQGITCALCHHSTYRKQVNDKPTIIPTGPSSKFNLQGYIQFLSNCATDPRFTSDYILDGLSYVYDLSWFDRFLYRFIVIPQTRKELLDFKESFAWMDERPDQGPGRIAPFNPVKFRVLHLPIDDTIGNSDMMPLWNEKAHTGFAYHWDGLETSLIETIREGAIGDGATQKSIELDGLNRVEDYILNVPSPPYPFAIDTALAKRGEPIFALNCATCHAFGGDRTGTVIPIEEIGTDQHRLDMWTQEAVDAYKAYADGYDWDFEHLQKTDGYVAVALDGLWLRAPYLHNGSVPSLTALFEKPQSRPHSFYRGYDVYDPDSVGFVASGVEAERFGVNYDTTLPANGNQGHEYGTNLSSTDKAALIEYLKTL